MRRLILIAFASVTVGASATAQQLTTFQEPELATTHHQIHVNGAALNYIARVGVIPIRNNEAGEIHGYFGFTYYALGRAPGQPARPVMLIWNGGPGSNSTTVQFMGFGPRRMKTADDAAHPTPVEPELYDNDVTWLEFADLVFVDPVGTGFGRPAKPEFVAEFYSTLGDIASTAEFIRVFRTRFDLLNAPVFVAGESYGTWRAAGAAEALERRGQHVNGVVLISGGLAMGQVGTDAVRTALFVPARTATAFYHKKLANDLMRDEAAAEKEARDWALSIYAPAWERRETLNDDEREKIIAGIARYTGVDPSTIDRKNLMMTSPQFTSTLLKEQGLTLGRYDMRVTQAAGGRGGSAAPDGTGAARNEVIMRYMRQELAFKTDLAYQGAETGYSSTLAGGRGAGPGSRWKWDQGETPLASGDPATTRANQAVVGSGDGPPGGSQPWMRRAMGINPSMKLFVAAGQYDSLNSCADNEYLVTTLDPNVARNVTTGCYGGGHMMYDTKDARFRLRRDIAAFVASATAATGRP
jgi:hypothetical protein